MRVPAESGDTPRPIPLPVQQEKGRKCSFPIGGGPESGKWYTGCPGPSEPTGVGGGPQAGANGCFKEGHGGKKGLEEAQREGGTESGPYPRVASWNQETEWLSRFLLCSCPVRASPQLLGEEEVGGGALAQQEEKGSAHCRCTVCGPCCN